MSKTNYNKISTAPGETEPVTVSVDLEVNEEIEEPVAQATPVGIVMNCRRLNVRKRPNVKAEVVCEVLVGSELAIDMKESTNEWYKVCTSAGCEGFCMKQYVEIQQ